VSNSLSTPKPRFVINAEQRKSPCVLRSLNLIAVVWQPDLVWRGWAVSTLHSFTCGPNVIAFFCLLDNVVGLVYIMS
jgi:hypothetical protein